MSVSDQPQDYEGTVPRGRKGCPNKKVVIPYHELYSKLYDKSGERKRAVVAKFKLQ